MGWYKTTKLEGHGLASLEELVVAAQDGIAARVVLVLLLLQWLLR